MTNIEQNSNVTFVSLLLQHLLIDAVSIYVVLTVIKYHPEITFSAIILYNFLAFATQWIFGLILDRIGRHKAAAILSVLLAIVSLLFSDSHQIWPVVAVGLANSLFHVSAGSMVLRTHPNKAFYQGVFVAPGAIGLFLGTKLPLLFFLPVLIVFLISNFILLSGYMPKKIEIARKTSLPVVLYISILVLFVIGVRSLVAGSVSFPWKTQPDYSIYANLLILGAFVGKALGGWLADKLGLTVIGIGSLLVSIPLLFFGNTYPFSGVLWMVFFQMTMPVTLLLLYHVLKLREGLSFGLTTLFLFIGTCPIYFKLGYLFNSSLTKIILVLVSALSLLMGCIVYRAYSSKIFSASIKL